jgi:NitT/TauT family transport system substrate-binding protein
MQRPLKRLFAGVLAALCAAALAGCGDDDSPDAATGRATTVKVGVVPIVDVAPLFLGVEQGFFRDEDLTIQTQFAEGGAAIVPAVMSGDLQIGFSNTTSLVIARSKGLPMRIIANGAAAGTNADDAPDAVMVRGDSKIRGAGDLEGRTVAVNTLNNVATLTLNSALERAGADYRKVKVTEVPFPDMAAAIEAGRVDAAMVQEPFVTALKAAGGRVLFNPMEETERNYTFATYFANERFIEEQPDVLERFVRALGRSLDYAQQHPDEARRAVLGYTKTPADAAKAMTLARWERELDTSSIELTARLAERYGYVERAPAIDTLVWDGRG